MQTAVQVVDTWHEYRSVLGVVRHIDSAGIIAWCEFQAIAVNIPVFTAPGKISLRLIRATVRAIRYPGSRGRIPRWSARDRIGRSGRRPGQDGRGNSSIRIRNRQDGTHPVSVGPPVEYVISAALEVGGGAAYYPEVGPQTSRTARRRRDRIAASTTTGNSRRTAGVNLDTSRWTADHYDVRPSRGAERC